MIICWRHNQCPLECKSLSIWIDFSTEEYRKAILCGCWPPHRLISHFWITQKLCLGPQWKSWNGNQPLLWLLGCGNLQNTWVRIFHWGGHGNPPCCYSWLYTWAYTWSRVQLSDLWLRWMNRELHEGLKCFVKVGVRSFVILVLGVEYSWYEVNFSDDGRLTVNIVGVGSWSSERCFGLGIVSDLVIDFTL